MKVPLNEEGTPAQPHVAMRFESASPQDYATVGIDSTKKSARGRMHFRWPPKSSPTQSRTTRAGYKPFFPADLLDPTGPWVTFSREATASAGGTFHIDFVKHRSVFTLHLRAPEGREQGIKFLEDFTKRARERLTCRQLRRSRCYAGRSCRAGRLLVSPFVESLQLFVVTPPRNARYKFTLDRADLLAGRFGLVPLGKDDPADTSSFESLVLPDHIRLRQMKQGSRWSRWLHRSSSHCEVPPALNTCVNCHGATVTGPRLFVFGTNPSPAHSCSRPPTCPPRLSLSRRKRAMSGSCICVCARRWNSHLGVG